jgi:hypothetical protein
MLRAAVIEAPFGSEPTLFKGRDRRSAPITFFNEDTALAYAELAAKLNPHDDLDNIRWPRISDPMDRPLPIRD